jgi:alpha,alpha-trehalase
MCCDFRPGEERLREALCTLGNGYLATRGAAPEALADQVHYPGTYLAGGYDRQVSEIAGRTVESEDSSTCRTGSRSAFASAIRTGSS